MIVLKVPEAANSPDEKARILYLESFIPEEHLEGVKICLEVTNNPYLAALEMWGACLVHIKIKLEEDEYNQKIENSLRE